MFVSERYVYMGLWVSQENILWWIQNECECSLDNTPRMSVSVYVLVISATAITKYFVSRIYNWTCRFHWEAPIGCCLPADTGRTLFIALQGLCHQTLHFLCVKEMFSGQRGWKPSTQNNKFTAFSFFLFSRKAVRLKIESCTKPGETNVRIYLPCESLVLRKLRTTLRDLLLGLWQLCWHFLPFCCSQLLFQIPKWKILAVISLSIDQEWCHWCINVKNVRLESIC